MVVPVSILRLMLRVEAAVAQGEPEVMLLPERLVVAAGTEQPAHLLLLVLVYLEYLRAEAAEVLKRLCQMLAPEVLVAVVLVVKEMPRQLLALQIPEAEAEAVVKGRGQELAATVVPAS